MPCPYWNIFMTPSLLTHVTPPLLSLSLFSLHPHLQSSPTRATAIDNRQAMGDADLLQCRICRPAARSLQALKMLSRDQISSPRIGAAAIGRRNVITNQPVINILSKKKKKTQNTTRRSELQT